MTTQSTPKQSTAAPTEGTITAPPVQATLKAPKQTTPSSLSGAGSKSHSKVTTLVVAKPTHNALEEEAPSVKPEPAPSLQAAVNNCVEAHNHHVEGSASDRQGATQTFAQGNTKPNKDGAVSWEGAEEGDGGGDANGWDSANVVDGDGWDSAQWWNNEDGWDGAQDDADGWNVEEGWDSGGNIWDGADGATNDEVGMGVPTMTHPPAPVVDAACAPKVVTTATPVPPQVPQNANATASVGHPEQVSIFVRLAAYLLGVRQNTVSYRERIEPKFNKDQKLPTPTNEREAQ